MVGSRHCASKRSSVTKAWRLEVREVSREPVMPDDVDTRASDECMCEGRRERRAHKTSL